MWFGDKRAEVKREEIILLSAGALSPVINDNCKLFARFGTTIKHIFAEFL